MVNEREPRATSRFLFDQDGLPVEGRSMGPGFLITWEGDADQQAEQIAAVMEACEQRLEFLKRTAYAKPEHDEALAAMVTARGAVERSKGDRLEAEPDRRPR